MELLASVFLGILQGILEWLPVSSEGVVTLAMTQLLGEGALYSVNIAIWLHLGTMFATFVYFRRDFARILRKLPDYVSDATDEGIFGGELLGTTSFLIIGTSITAVVGGLLYFFGIKELAARPRLFTGLMGFALLLTGLLRFYRSKARKVVSDLNLADTTLVGFLQGLSIIPGVSRSGSTVFGLFYRDFKGRDAFRLSFMLSVPAVLIANVGMKLTSGLEITGSLLLAALISFLIGYLTIDLLLKLAERLEVAYLCFLLAALTFASLFL